MINNAEIIFVDDDDLIKLVIKREHKTSLSNIQPSALPFLRKNIAQ